MAVGYATLTTLVLSCSPRVKDAVLNQWICQDEVIESVAEDATSLGLPGESTGVDETLSIFSSEPPEPVKKTWL